MEIIIPYAPNMELGKAYNKAMQTVNDWVLFLDHDALILCPHYFDACINVIERLDHKAGWITAVTNRIACAYQLDRFAPNGDDIMNHMQYAKKRWTEFGDTAQLIDGNVPNPGFSGFFMLTHREAWEKVGGFIDGFLGVDNAYWKALIKNNYDTYIMPGIYVYHIYRNKKYWEKF